jgi:hypothetical protein
MITPSHQPFMTHFGVEMETPIPSKPSLLIRPTEQIGPVSTGATWLVVL